MLYKTIMLLIASASCVFLYVVCLPSDVEDRKNSDSLRVVQEKARKTTFPVVYQSSS